jgi:segregation and condensation protein A
VTSSTSTSDGFQVRLSNFEGPFDLLLQLIFAHRLDVTEVALHQVTDDFIVYTKAIGAQLELDETTAFLVVAATLLDLKAARLLPAGEVEDAEDLALSWRPLRCAATPGRWHSRTGSPTCCPR